MEEVRDRKTEDRQRYERFKEKIILEVHRNNT